MQQAFAEAPPPDVAAASKEGLVDFDQLESILSEKLEDAFRHFARLDEDCPDDDDLVVPWSPEIGLVISAYNAAEEQDARERGDDTFDKVQVVYEDGEAHLVVVKAEVTQRDLQDAVVDAEYDVDEFFAWIGSHKTWLADLTSTFHEPAPSCSILPGRSRSRASHRSQPGHRRAGSTSTTSSSDPSDPSDPDGPGEAGPRLCAADCGRPAPQLGQGATCDACRQRQSRERKAERKAEREQEAQARQAAEREERERKAARLSRAEWRRLKARIREEHELDALIRENGVWARHRPIPPGWHNTPQAPAHRPSRTCEVIACS